MDHNRASFATRFALKLIGRRKPNFRTTAELAERSIEPLARFIRPPGFANVVRVPASNDFEYCDGTNLIVPPCTHHAWLTLPRTGLMGAWDSCLDRDHNLIVSFEHAEDAVLYRMKWEGKR